MMRLHLYWLVVLFPFLIFGKLESCRHVDAAAEQQQPGEIRTLTAPAFRHNGPVTELVVTDAGKKLISGSWNDGAILWDVATGRRLKKLADRVSMVMALAPAGDLLALRTGTRCIDVYNLLNDKVQFSFETENPLALAFSPDGATLAGIHDYDIKLWKTASGEASNTLKGHMLVVYSVVFHPDGKTLFSMSHDGTLRQWDLATGKEIWRLTEPAGWFGYSLAVSADGKTLAMETGTGLGFSPNSYRAQLRLLDTGTLKERFRVVLPASRAQDVAVSANGRYMAAAFAQARPEDGYMRLWDSWTGKQIRLDPVSTQAIYRVSFFPDGKTIASAGNDGVVRLWNVADGMEHALTRGPGTGRVQHLAFSPTGKVLASVAGDGPIQMWDIVKGIPGQALVRRGTSPGVPIFSPDGEHLVSTVFKHPVIAADVWKVRTGECLHTFQPVSGEATFSPDGKTLAIADTELNIRFWDMANGTELRRLKAIGTPVHAMAISPDNRFLAGAFINGGVSGVRLWHIATGNTVMTLALETNIVDRLWFSTDGLLLFAFHGYVGSFRGGPRFIDVFDIATGQCLFTCNTGSKGPHGHWAAPDGRSLVVASDTGKFRVLDLISGEAVGPDVAYGGDFTVAEFTPDGKLIALGYDDGRIVLWEPPQMAARKSPLVDFDEGKLWSLWRALGGTDAKLAYQARWLLSDAPKQTLRLMRDELRLTPHVQAEQVEAWISQLDGSSFKVRDVAYRELEKAGEAFEPLIRKALDHNPTLEMRRRIELLLKKLAAPATGETLRALRAIAVLETIGGEEARAIMRDLAGGAPGSRVTEAAKGAMKRGR
jgi:WD40 repeat protein